VWDSKLDNVKKDLRKWLKESYQSPRKKWRDKVQQLVEHYKKMEEAQIEEDHLHRERDLTQQISSLSRQEKKNWRLKYRSLWLQVRDSNTSFFHKQAKA